MNPIHWLRVLILALTPRGRATRRRHEESLRYLRTTPHETANRSEEARRAMRAHFRPKAYPTRAIQDRYYEQRWRLEQLQR
ncbi:hypothetical protein LCGC14_0313660 [marine sediment metagenome]|uniref:Uncharacterized protein n=1 Tax=marine sediment metagenome TaxID=412755 RepID=A0A0F9TRY1_9ZZZZ